METEMSKQVVMLVMCFFFAIVFETAAQAEIDVICGTQEAYEAFLRGGELARPSNGPLFINTPNFVVHFDTIGVHACTPAYAESVAVYAEFVRAKQVGGLGFAAPPPDTGGPDSRYDMYVRYINPYYGQSFTESPYPDPYPTGYTSYVFLRNTMTWNQLRATVAHEFNHGCQKRYSGQYNWWYENVACWAEDICYDYVNWYVLSLNTSPNPLADPHLSVEIMENEYEYAAQIWPMFLDEYYGLSCIRLIWEEIGQQGGYNVLNAIDAVLQDYDSDLKLALGNYAVWRYFTGARADTSNYFHESNLWPTSYVNPIHQHSGPGSGNQGSDYLDGPGGTSFIEFYTSPDYLLKNSLVGESGGDWRVYSVGYSTETGHVHYMMDCVEYWSILPTTEQDTTILIPTVTSMIPNNSYDYSGESISSAPTPPEDPDLEISSILSPTGTVTPYSTITPTAERLNNASSTTVDTTWISFYIGDWYSDSREIGPLGPGQTDTVSFADWSSLERDVLEVRCVGGGDYDSDVQDNYCDSSVLVELSDFEVLEIISPRGVIAQNVAVTPGVLIQNNGTSSNTVSVTLAVENYSDVKSIYLAPGSSAELLFAEWTPTQTGACSTSCSITTPDQRMVNNTILGEVFVLDETGTEGEPTLPPATYLHSPAPNPFASSTTVTYELAESGNIRLSVFDLHGRLIETLVDGSMIAGVYSAVLDGTDMASGIYFIRLAGGSQIITTRAVLLK